MLLEGAQEVSANGLPIDSEAWQKIKGVGRYTAGAIASIALREPVPLVDGNVERVFARLAACHEARPELTTKAWTWAEQVLDHERPGDWNQALMELGASVCTPANPSCNTCPVRDHCLARKQGLVDQLPVAKLKPATVKLKHTVWIPIHKGLYGVRQIPHGKWWAGMWEFPRVNSDEATELPQITGDGELVALGNVWHSVTNHRIDLSVSLIKCSGKTANLKWHSAEALEGLPVPAPQRRALALALLHTNNG